MDDLVQFLRHYLDLEERRTRCAFGKSPQWYPGSAYDEPNNPERANVANGADEPITGDTLADFADHIAANDPARVLADIDIKRQIIDAYAEAAANEGHAEHTDGRANGLGHAVRLLSLPYSHLRDYKPEWRS